MRRVLLEVGGFQLQTFGVLIALGVLAGLWLAAREGKRKGLGDERILDLGLYVIIVGILGARLSYVLFYDPAYYLANPAQVLALHRGGLSIHGALAGGVLAGAWYARRHRLSFWRLADTVAPSLALGEAIGRTGCDIFGKPMAAPWPWGVTVDGQLLHPAQVYEFLLDYLLFYFLWRRREAVRYDGQLFATYLVLYPAVRGFVEFWRVNPVVWGPFSIAHLLSLAFILAGLAAMWALRRRNRAAGIPGRKAPAPHQSRPALEALAVLGMAAVSLGLYYGFSIQ